MKWGISKVVGVLLLVNGSVDRAHDISVEQFYSLLKAAELATSQRGWLNGFGEREKVCIPAGRGVLLASVRPFPALGGYVIPCASRLSPTVTSTASSRVSLPVPETPHQTGVWSVSGCFLIEGGRGSEFVGATGFVDWISCREKFSHWTGGVHGHGC